MSLCEVVTFDAMLSDVDMQGMNGHELVRWINGKHPKVRCALMSGSSLECEECPITGKCTLIPKPFIPSEAVAIIAAMLGRRTKL